MKRHRSLDEKYPPSEPCSCEVCVGYCARPGWWTVKEAAAALKAGFGPRMMLEMSPNLSFGVLSPAFKGCEANFASKLHASRGCTFLIDGKCELHGTGLQPLECRHCHHDRPGAGPRCHADIESEWKGPRARDLIRRWGRQTGFWSALSAGLRSDRV